MVLAGKTLRETVREVFHARGISATSGREMTAPTLRDVLLNPRVRGLSTFTPTDPETGLRFRKDRKTIGKGNWPAIIDEETGARLDLILNDPGRKTTHAGTAPTRFLASVLTCTCGDPMYSRSRKNKDGSPRRFYTCKRSRPGERHVSIGDEIDDIIEAIILKRMAKPDAIEAIQVALTDPSKEEARDKIRQLHAERAVLLTRREDLEQSVAEGELSASAFNRIEAKIIGKISKIDSSIARVQTEHQADPLAEEFTADTDFATWWDNASVEDKRRLTRLLMEIHIAPGKHGAKTFDPNRIKITWSPPHA